MTTMKTNREILKNKYDGLCAYSGTLLEDDWQIDHFIPKLHYEIGLAKGDQNNINNLMPCQRIINHYKRSLGIEMFRIWLLGELHLRLRKLPKNPRVEKSINHKRYLLKVASYFKITAEKPFNKSFYFETLHHENH